MSRDPGGAAVEQLAALFRGARRNCLRGLRLPRAQRQAQAAQRTLTQPQVAALLNELRPMIARPSSTSCRSTGDADVVVAVAGRAKVAQDCGLPEHSVGPDDDPRLCRVRPDSTVREALTTSASTATTGDPHMIYVTDEAGGCSTTSASGVFLLADPETKVSA